MNPEEIHRLVEEYRDGTIGAADARRLAEAIRAGGEAADLVRRELALSGHLRAASRSGSAPSAADRSS